MTDIETSVIAVQNPKRKYAFSLKVDSAGALEFDSDGKTIKVFDVFEADGTTKKTMIECDVKWSHRTAAVGDTWEPFMATPWDDLTHGQKLWTDLNNGVYGSIDESDLEG
jgi:hypothetical protein